MAAIKPLLLYSHVGGPNPWKVAIIMDELKVPYETKQMQFDQLKNSEFDAQYPNGRVPAVEDPNTGLKLWESGAIIEYLLDTYDKENKLSYTDAKQKYDTKCWLHFQTSGQGPYYGQLAWFTFYHPEKNLKSCLDRYSNEIRRVIGVIDKHLKNAGTPYLVGDKVTYADLAFVPWHWLVAYAPHVMGEGFPKEWRESFPHAWAWHEKLDARPSVTKSREARFSLMQKQ